MPKGQHKLPIMVVRQMEEECTSICDENESKKTSPSPNHPENYLAFAIAYILSSFLPLTEKSLPAVQKAVANNIEHPDFSELSSQPPPHQYPLSPFGGDPFYLPDGGNGYGEGCGELPGGLPGAVEATIRTTMTAATEPAKAAMAKAATGARAKGRAQTRTALSSPVPSSG
uniref:Uncharacterized protein n=1 Tax=Bionectria ochroleuca TaxID=29856 RepID=A0A8H7NJ89_BIOOC